MAQGGKHLKDDGRKGHGRRNALICIAIAIVLIAGIGYARWRRTETEAADTQAATEELEAATTEDETDDGTVEDPSSEVDSNGADASEEATDDEGSDAGDTDSDETSDEEADEEEAKRQPGEHAAFTDEDLAAMDSLKGQIAVSGAPDGFSESDGYQELLYQVAAWQGNGWSLGFVLTDLNSGASVSYNVDQVFYPASSIKAPYVCSLYEELIEAGGNEATLDPVAENTIVNSDNDSFRQLHATYGESAFSTWLAAAGVPATTGHAFSYFTQYYYPQISCAQLDLMWAQIYRYCTSGTGPSQTFASYLSQRTTSPIADAVGDRSASWGKAGWYYSTGDYGAEPATVDAGIVFAESGTYRLVMMSDAPGELESMADLAWGMDAAAQDLAV